MDFSAVLRQVAAAFEDASIPFALAGGVAVAAHGIQRTTLDLDFVVPAELADAARAELDRLGFTTLRTSAGFSNHLRHQPTPQRVDLLYVKGTTRAVLFARAPTHELLGVRLRVLHPDHLAAMKLFAASQNPSRAALDFEDVRALLRSGKLDAARLEEYLDRYGVRALWDKLGYGG